MEIAQHAWKRMAGRLTESEMTIVESRTRLAWERRDTPSLAVVAHELNDHRECPDGSNGNLVIACVKQGTLASVFLRRDTQEIKAGRLECSSLAWMIPKRPTGPKARKHRQFTNRRY